METFNKTNYEKEKAEYEVDIKKDPLTDRERELAMSIAKKMKIDPKIINENMLRGLLKLNIP